MRRTHTYTVLEVSAATFDEIKHKLLAASYEHVFNNGGNEMDMSGIALGRSAVRLAHPAPGASDLALQAHELARKIVTELTGTTDAERVVKVALILRGEHTIEPEGIAT